LSTIENRVQELEKKVDELEDTIEVLSDTETIKEIKEGSKSTMILMLTWQSWAPLLEIGRSLT